MITAIMGTDIDIKIQRNLHVPYSREWFHNTVSCILNSEKVTEDIEVSLFITDDARVRKLNKRYRGIDSTTDVLSFSASDDAAGDQPFTLPVDCVRQLGEIIISYPQAMKQSMEFRNDIGYELRFLIVHGMLHLLGYDHELTEDEKRMKRREKAIVKRLEKTEHTG
jgi:probable rRNA maturation factor